MHLSSTLHPVAPQGSGLRRDLRKTEGCEQKVTESAAPLGGGGGGEKPAGQTLRPPGALHYKMTWKYWCWGCCTASLAPATLGGLAGAEVNSCPGGNNGRCLQDQVDEESHGILQ